MPMIESQPDALAHVYARSLLELVESKGGRPAVEDTLGELEDILELARSNPKFGELFASRVVSAKARAKSLDTIFKGRVNNYTLWFLQVLNEKGRLGHLGAVVAAFEQRSQDKYGVVEVDLYTAEALATQTGDTIKRRLGEVLKKDVVIHGYVEPAMIGGIKIQIGDQLIDASVATRLRQMRDRLSNQGAGSLKSRLGRIIEG